jgi:hypothetical protein
MTTNTNIDTPTTYHIAIFHEKPPHDWFAWWRWEEDDGSDRKKDHLAEFTDLKEALGEIKKIRIKHPGIVVRIMKETILKY